MKRRPRSERIGGFFVLGADSLALSNSIAKFKALTPPFASETIRGMRVKRFQRLTLTVSLSIAAATSANAAWLTSTMRRAALSAGAPVKALNDIEQFVARTGAPRNSKYVTIVDYTLHSGRRRMFVLDRTDEIVKTLNAAHGSGSDRDNDGYARTFSNTPESKMTSLGFFYAQERYNGSHGLSLRLDGLEARNNKARARGIVIHGATYVKPTLAQMGRSWGCPAVPENETAKLVAQLEGGSLFYAFIDGIENYRSKAWLSETEHLNGREGDLEPKDGE